MNRYLAAAGAAVALMLVAAAFIFFFAPTDALQGPVQRIFYLHVSSAIAAFVSFAVVVVGSVAYLWRESVVGDRVARSAALVGVVFTTVTLVMGMMWAKPIWGTFWTWDARLTSTLVLWIIYAGYLLVRRFTAMFSAASIVWDREFGFLREMMVAPVRRSSIVIGKCLGGASVAGFQGLIVICLAPLVHVHYDPLLILGIFVLQLLLAFTITAFGVMIAIRYRIEALTDAQPQSHFVLQPAQRPSS